MFDRIFPRSFDNQFHGHFLALWLFVPIVLIKIVVGLIHIFANDSGVDTIEALFAHVGVAQLLLGVLCVAVLLKYRSMIPLMYSLMLLHYFAEDWISAIKPIAVAGASLPAQVVLIMTLFGFVLSLYRPPQQADQEARNQSHSIKI